jgi:hypothetical protein
MDNKSLALGTLSVTALILAVALLLVGHLAQPQVALASGQNVAGGDYVMMGGQFQSSLELVYIMDRAARRLNAYGFDWNKKQLVLLQTIDLTNLPEPPSQ